MSKFTQYYNAIPVIRAREQLEMISAISYPNLKKQHQEKMRNDLERKANSVRSKPKEIKINSFTQLKNVMGGVNGQS